MSFKIDQNSNYEKDNNYCTTNHEWLHGECAAQS